MFKLGIVKVTVLHSNCVKVVFEDGELSKPRLPSQVAWMWREKKVDKWERGILI